MLEGEPSMGKINPEVYKGGLGHKAGLGVIRLVFTEVTFVNRLETTKNTSQMKYGERII